MIAIPILAAAVLAVATAAPHDYAWSLGPRNALSDSFEDGLFDTNKFWSHFESEMQRMDEMMNEFSKRFPSAGSATAGIEGNEYVFIVPLTGYEEKDIVVKAREGLLMIQAAHTDESGNQRTYMDLRTLPAGVDPSGAWTYKEGVLKVTFPLTKKQGDDESTVAATEKPDDDRSREEMDKKNDEDAAKDADVGLDNHESDETREKGVETKEFKVREKEIETNEIYRNPVEATTYSVRHDVKDDVEFVPVRY